MSDLLRLRKQYRPFRKPDAVMTSTTRDVILLLNEVDQLRHQVIELVNAGLTHRQALTNYCGCERCQKTGLCWPGTRAPEADAALWEKVDEIAGGLGPIGTLCSPGEGPS